MASEDLLEAAVAGRRGTVVDGFTLGERLNAGGAGYVFRVAPAAGAGPGFPLVMKLPAVGPGEPLEGVVGFEMELMVLPALTGPHVPRIVASSSVALCDCVLKGRFDARLFYRLNIIHIVVPA